MRQGATVFDGGFVVGRSRGGTFVRKLQPEVVPVVQFCVAHDYVHGIAGIAEGGAVKHWGHDGAQACIEFERMPAAILYLHGRFAKYVVALICVVVQTPVIHVA
jgi:hypothetical protein